MATAFHPDRPPLLPPPPPPQVEWAVQRGHLLGAAAAMLLACAFALAAAAEAGRWGGGSAVAAAVPPSHAAPAVAATAAPIASRDLRFEDRADGAVTVHEAAGAGTAGSNGDDRLVAVLDPGTNGFIRGTLRGLARERRQRREDIGRQAVPFRLARWADGRLTLEDRATGRVLDLNAFGHTNADAFARLLTATTPMREETP